MKKIAFIVAVLFVFMNFHCNHDDQPQPMPCTTEARAGLNITVLDSETEQALFEGVTVTATDGTYVETLEAFPGSTVFSGAWERKGDYTVTVAKEGYQSFTSEPITVTSDVCHVIPQSRTVRLVPE